MRSPKQATKKTVTRRAPITETKTQAAARKKALADATARRVAKTQPQGITGRVAARKLAQTTTTTGTGKYKRIDIAAMKREVQRQKARGRARLQRMTAEKVSEAFVNFMYVVMGFALGILVMAGVIAKG